MQIKHVYFPKSSVVIDLYKKKIQILLGIHEEERLLTL